MKYITILIVMLGSLAHAQDPIYTNTQQSLVALNTSFAGSNGLLRYKALPVRFIGALSHDGFLQVIISRIVLYESSASERFFKIMFVAQFR